MQSAQKVFRAGPHYLISQTSKHFKFAFHCNFSYLSSIMDPNSLATNTVKCTVCSSAYLACTSCRLFGTEPCQYGLSDPRAPFSRHDNPAFENDQGSSGSGVIDLNQVVPGFKPEAHMPTSSDSTETPAKQTDRASK